MELKRAKKKLPTGNAQFGALVTRMRGKMDQSILAARCGVSRSMMNHIESGLRRPTVDVLYALSIIFDVDMDGLYRSSSPRQATDAKERAAS